MQTDDNTASIALTVYPYFFFFLLNLLFRLYCIFMFLLIHLGLFGIYVSFTQHPSLLNSLHLSLPGPL